MLRLSDSTKNVVRFHEILTAIAEHLQEFFFPLSKNIIHMYHLNSYTYYLYKIANKPKI